MADLDPAQKYYATEYHRRNMQVAKACGAHAAIERALERALSIKSIPIWMIAYLESANNRLPGLQYDLAAWRDLAPDAPASARRAPDPRDEVIRGLREALINAAANLETVSRADQLGDVQKQQCRAWSDEALAAARQPYMGQIMAECDCPRQDECQRAGRCIAEGRA